MSPTDAVYYFVNSIEAWRIEMRLESFSLLGHSFGGYIATFYSLMCPNKVEQLFLLSPLGGTFHH